MKKSLAKVQRKDLRTPTNCVTEVLTYFFGKMFKCVSLWIAGKDSMKDSVLE